MNWYPGLDPLLNPLYPAFYDPNEPPAPPPAVAESAPKARGRRGPKPVKLEPPPTAQPGVDAEKPATKRGAKRSRKRANPDAGDVDTSASVAKRNERIAEIRRRKENMAYPKGSFLLRFSDLDQDDHDFLWCVDNHQLLQKFIPEPEDGLGEEMKTFPAQSPIRTYVKTDRYTGWFSNHYWEVLDLSTRAQIVDNKVRVNFPTRADIDQQRARLVERRDAELKEQKSEGPEADFEDEEGPIGLGSLDGESD